MGVKHKVDSLIDLRLNPKMSREDISKNIKLLIDENNSLKSIFQNQPFQLDVIEAQVTYTAMMTDTLLEV